MKILCFGDFLIHFSPCGHARFMQAETMRMSFTGAEANVCAALSFWGIDTAFVTRLPDHALAKRALASLRACNVDISHCAIGGSRMGIYYLENGASLRTSSIICDSANSAFTEAQYKDFDWDAILADIDMLYLSGITPALSENLFTCAKALFAEATHRGITIVYDINYHPSLCSTESAAYILQALSPHITTLIGNEEHLKMLLGIDSEFGQNHQQERLWDISNQVVSLLRIPQIAITVRHTYSASDAGVCASFFDGQAFAVSPFFRVHVVDCGSSEDAFSAGLIYALHQNFDTQTSVNYAAASNAMKHTIINDINFSTVEEIQHIMRNQSRTDVRR
ncbi:MAG: sugar kinase [Clostridia bacterium]|nr:sugar kinase [Clostridia bacterium]